MAAVVLGGAPQCARARDGEEAEEGMSLRESERGSRRWRGTRGGDQAVEGHAGREEPAWLVCAPGTQLLLLLAEGRRQCCPWWAGLAGGAGPGGCQVSQARPR